MTNIENLVQRDSFIKWRADDRRQNMLIAPVIRLDALIRINQRYILNHRIAADTNRERIRRNGIWTLVRIPNVHVPQARRNVHRNKRRVRRLTRAEINLERRAY